MREEVVESLEVPLEVQSLAGHAFNDRLHALYAEYLAENPAELAKLFTHVNFESAKSHVRQTFCRLARQELWETFRSDTVWILGDYLDELAEALVDWAIIPPDHLNQLGRPSPTSPKRGGWRYKLVAERVMWKEENDVSD